MHLLLIHLHISETEKSVFIVGTIAQRKYPQRFPVYSCRISRKSGSPKRIVSHTKEKEKKQKAFFFSVKIYVPKIVNQSLIRHEYLL